jgi:uncharacterized protein
MIVEDQSDVIAYLSSTAAHGGAAVERIDTHSAVVFLAASRVLKLKRAVRFDYLDFSTETRRRQACEDEVRINRRTAPPIYLGVVAVTREADGSLALNGAGQPVDWLVEMARFDQENLFDRLAARDALAVSLMPQLADVVASFHERAERRTDHGGLPGMRWVVDGNAAGLAEQGVGFLDPSRCDALSAASRAALEHHAGLLERRRLEGFVRRCHGDLHLRNIVLLDGRPTLFDAVEFNDEIACTDVLYDLAFLLMDLWRRHLPAHAHRVFNTYLTRTGDFEGLPLLPLFLSCRAAVRAKTSATAAGVQQDTERTNELQALAREYLEMALRLLHPPQPQLVAIGGVSGSGKSSLALAIAPSIGAIPGAVVLRSDEIRKALAGVPALEHLESEAYTAAMSARVYAEMEARARVVLDAGHSVIVDAVYARPDDRARLDTLAAATQAPFVALWLDAPADVLLSRVRQRQRDASDADESVVRRQLAAQPRPDGWHRIDASGSLSDTVRNALALIQPDASRPR